MQAEELPRAVAAASATASALGLNVDDAVVLQDSNRVVLRLLPCDVVVRVAHSDKEAIAALEIELARALAGTEGPIGLLDPRVEPHSHLCDGFVLSLWTSYDPVTAQPIPPADYAHALDRLHAGMRQVDSPTPHFTDRITEAQNLVRNGDRTPALSATDRELLSGALQDLRRAIGDRRAAEQILHGEPHPGNVLDTADGPLFIDFETCCRGPVEFDIAHAPEAVGEHARGIDRALLDECRGLILAMVAAWRWDVDDDYPNGRRAGRELLRALRDGPPWPTLDAVSPQVGRP